MPSQTSIETQSHYRICPLCEACCGLEVRTAAGRVISIRGAGNDVRVTYVLDDRAEVPLRAVA